MSEKDPHIGEHQTLYEENKKLKADIVEVITVIELGFLKGREKLTKYPYYSMIVY